MLPLRLALIVQAPKCSAPSSFLPLPFTVSFGEKNQQSCSFTCTINGGLQAISPESALWQQVLDLKCCQYADLSFLKEKPPKIAYYVKAVKQLLWATIGIFFLISNSSEYGEHGIFLSDNNIFA